jgi:hypothetical protein
MRNTKKKSKKLPYPGPEQCHPKIGKTRPVSGCISQEILDEVAKELHVEPKRSAIEKKLHVKAKNEYSFVKALPFNDTRKNEIIKSYLRPKRPDDWKDDPDKWLNSLDIMNVMNQYEEAFPEFEFMGPFPIDFAAPDPYKKDGKCLIQEMCEIKTSSALENGTKYIGIIYNLDPHYKGGSHWVALFINLDKKETIYFDSYGMEPPEQIQKFMKWLTTQDNEMTLKYIGRRFQYQNSECGMYSMYFIIMMLSGYDPTKFSRLIPPDTFMLELRSWLFST